MGRWKAFVTVATVTMGCAPESGVTAFNAEPEANITSHAAGTEVDEGVVTTFRGTAADADDDETELTATWYAGTRELCPAAPADEEGVTTCDAILTLNDREIVLEVRDPGGASDRADVNVVVVETGAPSAFIVSPTAKGYYYSDQKLTFEGVISDQEDTAEDLVTIWASDLDGPLDKIETVPDAEGTIVGFGYLTQGDHAVTLTVEDKTGKSDVASVTIVVGPPNTAPTCEITSPEDGGAATTSDVVYLEGVVDDVDVPAELLTVEWSSDKDGFLGASVPTSKGAVSLPYSDLSADVHTLTLQVTDEVDGVCTRSVTFAVGQPPTVIITEPVFSDVVNEGASTVFSADLTDADDGPQDLDLVWTSDLDGVLNTNPADISGKALFTTDSLTPGTHAVTLEATDPMGLQGFASVTFDVNAVPTAPTVVVSPNPATSSDDLIASASGSVDPDATGPISYLYTWYEDGALSGVSSTDTFPAASTVKGREYRAVVAATDGVGTGPTGEDAVWPDNSPPVLGAVSISPPSGIGVTSTLTCSASPTDMDGDVPTLTFAWTNDTTGASLGSTSVITLDDTIASIDDQLTCTVTATDDELATDTGYASVVVNNANPIVDSVTIDPATGVTATTTLTCTGTAYDPDGGTPTLSYAWTDVASGASMGTGDTLALDPATSAPGDTVQCTVTATDGVGGSDTGTATVDVENSAPTVDSVSINPPSGVTTSTTLTCAATASDVDGGAPTLDYAWENTTTAAALGTGTTLALDPSMAAAGDQVTCLVTATDGYGETGNGSASVTVDNTAPLVTSASITPNPAYTGDVLTCGWSGFYDADGHADLSTVDWSINGVGAGSGTTLPAGFVGGDTVGCTVTPFDGIDSGPPVSTSLVISNTPPVLADATLTPDPATELDVLTCLPGVTTDADGTTTFSYSYAWTVRGALTAATGSTLDGAWFAKGDDVYCQAVPHDGTEDGVDATSNTVTVINAPPSITSVSVSPEPATADDELTCSWSGYSDPDGDPDASRVVWTINGAIASTTPTLSGGFGAGDVVICEVTPSDGFDDGTPLTRTVSLGNSAPTIANVSITPDPAVSGDILTCSWTGYDDPDGDPDASFASWTVNGSGAGSGITLSTSLVYGDVVECSVTPFDGVLSGSPVTANLTVSNTPPVLDAVTLGPDPGYETSTLACTPGTTTDADGTSVFNYTYAWTVNGSDIGVAGDSLDGTYFDKTDSVACSAIPDDGTDPGDSVGSNVVFIANSAPSIATVSVTPDPATSDDTLTCAWTGYADPDGDADQSTPSWTVNGTAAGTGSTLSAAFVGGDLVTCTVTPYDGGDSGLDQLASVIIGNSAPSVDSVTITPDPAVAADTLTCGWTGYADPDGDADASTAAWTINGAAAGSGLTLSGGYVYGDTVVCTVTPFDGVSAGTPVDGTLVVSNTAPVLADATLTPDPAQEGDVLLCTPGSTTDVDGATTFTYSYTWTVNGSVVGEVTDSLDDTWFVKGDPVYCTAYPHDGTDTGAGVDSNTVTISNHAPSIALVEISPDPAESGDTLSCSWSGYDDPDGDPDASDADWLVNGTFMGSGLSLSSGFFRSGDSVTCSVTPTDGFDDGTPVETTIVIYNYLPEITSISIPETSPQTNDTINAIVATSDPDGDPVDLRYTWYVNGVATVATDSWLDGSLYFDKHEEIYVVATPNDGVDDGPSVQSNTVTAINTPPGAAVYSILPMGAVETLDDLLCEVTVPPADPDGDAQSYDFTWEYEGTSWGGTTYRTYHDDDSVPAAETLAGSWTCNGTPFDGEEYGPESNVSATIGVCEDSYLSFDGIDDYASLGSGENMLGITNAFTVTAWVYRNTGSGWGTVFSGEASESGVDEENAGIRLLFRDDAKIQGFYGTGLDPSWDTEGWSVYAMANDEWVHVAYTRVDRTMKLYYNGNERYDWGFLESGDVNFDGAGMNTDAYEVGRYLPGGGAAASEHWLGRIAHVAVWDYDMSQAEIQYVADNGIDKTNSSGLKGYWPMNEGGGSVLYDESGNGNDGVVVGASWIGPCP